jgi:hypothetical protein
MSGSRIGPAAPSELRFGASRRPNADAGIAAAYAGAYGLTVNGTWFDFDAGSDTPVIVDREEDMREIVASPEGDVLRVVRKVYVPATGGFARYLDIITNPTAMSMPLRAAVWSELASSTTTRYVVQPSDTGGTFAVTDDTAPASNRPALGHVFAGTGAEAITPTIKYVNGNGGLEYAWNTTIAPGETVIFMHFAIQRAPGDTNNAEAQAQALVDLSDAYALAGISAEERALIRNFVINP